jgi:uncharacterized RDD family membrane protein YckC
MGRYDWDMRAASAASKASGRKSRVEGTFPALSTSPGQANLAPTWKQEVNRRIAAHKTQKNTPAGPAPAQIASPGTAASRAAQAAARVAARYAKAPSFSEMLAEEARGAVRAAEAASRAALEAQAAAESVLAELEAASAGEGRWAKSTLTSAADHGLALAWKAPVEPVPPVLEVAQYDAAPDIDSGTDWESLDRQPVGIRWDEDLPMRPTEPVETRATRGPVVYERSTEETWTPDLYPQEMPAEESFHVVEPAPPSHANLIEFPRELVATRKVRPRRAEGHAAIGAPSGQLSIFEVDPASISTEPEAPAVLSESIAPEWQGPVWSGIELDAEPVAERVVETAAPVGAPALDLAPFGLRAMAALVDGALIVGAFMVAAATIAGHIKAMPSMKEMELISALALAAIALLYHALFFTLAEGTPGMKYARISLCTFDDELPTRAQKRSRLAALFLSLLPIGLGVAWAIFDEEHLSWHDRLSRTYLRRC